MSSDLQTASNQAAEGQPHVPHMETIDAQYIIEQNEKFRTFEEWMRDKTEHRIFELRRKHKRWLEWAENQRDESLMCEEHRAAAMREPMNCARIARIHAQFDTEKTEEDAILEAQIDRIRAKAESKIRAKREHCRMRCWTCADDGFAHLFTYRGRRYWRTYSGAMWKAGTVWEGNPGELGAWAGVWNGIYIGRGEEPSQPPVAMA